MIDTEPENIMGKEKLALLFSGKCLHECIEMAIFHPNKFAGCQSRLN